MYGLPFWLHSVNVCAAAWVGILYLAVGGVLIVMWMLHYRECVDADDNWLVVSRYAGHRKHVVFLVLLWTSWALWVWHCCHSHREQRCICFHGLIAPGNFLRYWCTFYQSPGMHRWWWRMLCVWWFPLLLLVVNCLHFGGSDVLMLLIQMSFCSGKGFR